jgi:mRNA-degrading endonuclease RelE of RelBE toxin-antitoxin system
MRDDLLNFRPTTAFLRAWSSLGLGESDMMKLEVQIMDDPDQPIVEGTGGARKIRFADEDANRGKSGSYRVIYAYFATNGVVYLFAAYGKNQKANLSAADKNELKKIIADIEKALKAPRKGK